MKQSITKGRIFRIFNFVLRLVLGGMLVLGGIEKFAKPMPLPTEQIEQVKLGKLTSENTKVLKIKNYIFGMKQTNYFWQFLGIIEIVFGLLLISQFFGLLGAIMSLPVTTNIFLFHVFLEFDEFTEIIESALLLAANLWLIAYEYKRWKGIVFSKQIFN